MRHLETRLAAKILRVAVGFLAWSYTSHALAIDPRGVQVGQEWAVVGVIADGDTNGIAVIRHQGTNKTYTVRVGDRLPENDTYSIRTVKRKQVILSDGESDVAISYQNPSKDAWEKAEPKSRFADSYFNGFTTVPMEYYEKNRAQELDAGGNVPFYVRKERSLQLNGGGYEVDGRTQDYGQRYLSEAERNSVETDVGDRQGDVDAYDHGDQDYDEIARYRQRIRQKSPEWNVVPKEASPSGFADDPAGEEWESEPENVWIDEGAW